MQVEKCDDVLQVAVIAEGKDNQQLILLNLIQNRVFFEDSAKYREVILL